MFVEVSPPVVKRSLWASVVGWSEDQNPTTKGYFKLFRNLRDESRCDLLSDPVLFRVWLYVFKIRLSAEAWDLASREESF